MIYTTIGLYVNGSFKVNGVLPQDLKEHVEFNKKYRFGRGLFVDGSCVHKGYLDDDEIQAFEEKIKVENLKAVRCTMTYK